MGFRKIGNVIYAYGLDNNIPRVCVICNTPLNSFDRVSVVIDDYGEKRAVHIHCGYYLPYVKTDD